MGFDLERFVDAVDAELKCRLCAQVLEDPLCPPCGHAFCAGCLIPWAVQHRTCPLRCQSISTNELRHINSLENLIKKLNIRCDYHSRGCTKTVKLQDLVDHKETCDFSPARCKNRECNEVLNLEDMDSHMRESCDYKADGICQKGCGLVLLHKDLVRGNHCCLEALRAQNWALRAKSTVLKLEAKKLRICWGRRERSLLSQLLSLQNESQLAALKYQTKLHQYNIHINNITKQITGNCEKREEHYKLLYEIAQVNGRDLSKARHEEAVEAFRSAKDPMVVQVLRRNPLSRGQGTSQEVQLVDVCTQTDITFEHIVALSKLRPPTPPVPDICPFLLSDSCHSLQTMEREYYEGSEYLSNIPADGERAEAFEYEEVELCRLGSHEKLGLTLCYRTDEEEDIAIYVSEVGPNSIAARDGRIREGDRILQINGRDVQDREEAVGLLSSEDCRSIVLLVARPEVQLEEGWLEDEHSEFLEELKMEMLEEQRREGNRLAAEQAEQPKKPEDEEITTDTATCSSNTHDKDSGVGRTDESVRQEESSEQEVLAHIQRRISRGLRDRGEPGPLRSALAALNTQCSLQCPDPQEEVEEEVEEVEEEVECEHFQQLLELKCHIRNSGECGLFYSRHSTIECSLTEQVGVERELRLLNEELRSIELECQSIMQAHQLRKARDPPPALAGIRERPEKSDKDSSSAYNTAESSRSTPLAMERSPDHSLQRRVSITNQKNLCHAAAPPARLQGPNAGCSPTVAGPQFPPAPDLSPYHGSQFRHASIPAHARHYQSYMHLVQQRSAVEYAHSQLSLAGVEPKMEWKVKVRGDGTRYITKRPARDRILRERALKIREERSGMTTDDDAASELKMGRYWSKEERKQQLARAREQRRRREFMQRSRLDSLREGPASGAEGRKEASILELSQRKMMKRRNKKILDNWMTIQELMTHGARAPEGAKVHNAFLSVTTV